ncbi:hypothetical protein H257_13385 [Aphanomyces astaci]|uniref:Uncharacterized protein n=1 Tax=Aphanomyces astaci TaxID=112090 RepID=W4FUS0_APHAT|nr:hypothetical protein H257_13385 [Aphanomyces astaci]ETV71245.1 hypothetical protein H257_13385 [Aphanomyces astaci]|eukprot:XP_009839185.1 hypothetical protein H257_13385 [Aphanomyces astaci]
MTLPALYAVAAVIVAIIVGMYVAWKKSQFLWPYVYVTCSATLTTVLVQVCTTHTLALISMSAVITIGLVVTFSACESRVVVLVSALVVVGTTIGPTLPALEVFIPLAIAGTLVIVGSTVLTTTHTSVGRFFVGAAAPIGVIDALYALIWQGHPSLLVAFAASDMTPTDLGVGLVTVVLAAISGLVVLRRVCCLDVVPAVTGGFLASLAGTSFVWTLLDMSVQTFAIARALGGVAVCGLGWYFGPRSSPQSSTTSPIVGLKTATTASTNMCTARVVLAPPTQYALNTPTGDFARDRTNVV